ncbi:intraflagellar transport protein 52 homolog [Onthophagus taurus]|uniref:intraflagellar transport protein 52 homolog n=1 Tax=Onthophagus taurus TaxID=166361 RepID=UPI0039BDECED
MAPVEENNLVENKNTIIFNNSKGELFKLTENYKIFQRKVKLSWKIIINKEEVSSQLLKNANLIILPGPQNPFDESELNSLKTFINEGGRVLVLLSESNQNDISNINILLEEYGIIPNLDTVIRTHYYKYFHPKECYIGEVSINNSLNRNKSKLNVIYPFGCTLTVTKPAVVAFTSGATTFPVDRPLGALYYNHSTGGRLLAIGSGHMFADKYIDHEMNEKFREMIFDFLLTNDLIKIVLSDHDDLDVWDYHIVPDTSELAERPKLCLTEAITHTVSGDYMKLFNRKMYSMNTDLVPDAIKVYEKLGVKHQLLKVISPNFEAPLPSLQAAVFPPSFRELAPPPLELFDLDEAFSSVFSRLAQFTNKYLSTGSDKQTEKELEFYIKEASKIVRLDENITDAKEILYSAAVQCAYFKSMDNIK